MKSYIALKNITAQPMTRDEANKKEIPTFHDDGTEHEGYTSTNIRGESAWIPKTKFEEVYFATDKDFINKLLNNQEE